MPLPPAKFSFAVGFSFVVHFLFFLILWILSLSSPSPLAGRGGMAGENGLLVEILPTMTSNNPSSWKIARKIHRNEVTKKASPSKETGPNASPILGEGSGQGGPGSGSGPEGGASLILAQIRGRIERAKRYPLLARKSGISGKSLIHFRIDEKGQPQEVVLKTSSGSPILDEEALTTIRRASPFPVYENPLELWIRFEIEP